MSNPKFKRLYKEEHSVVNTDTFDRDRFVQLTDISPKLNKVAEEQVRKNQNYLPLMGDMWSALFKMKPGLKDIEDGQEPNNPMNRSLMQRVLEDDEYTKMHQITKLDDFSSAIGSMRLTEIVTEWIDQQQEGNEQLKDQLYELNQKMKEQLSQENKKKTEKQNKKNEQLSQDISEIQRKIQQQLEQELNQPGNGLTEGIAKANAETQEAKENLESLLGGGAGSGDSEMKKIPLRDQIALAETLRDNDKIKKIAEWAGKFKSIARKKQKSKHIESIDRSGMTFGDDVERLLPQELALLKKDSTRIDFLRRFAEGQTMMYSPKGKDTLGKGPIVACLDQSGSMNNLDTQSKGFVLALAMIAKKQKRDFCVITFSTKVGKVFTYEKGKITPNDLVELSESFLSGGTHYAPAVTMAIDYIEKNKRFKKADLLFVTDGNPSDMGAIKRKEFQDKITKMKRENNLNILALLIGNDVTANSVKIFADKVIKANDFGSSESHELFSI